MPAGIDESESKVPRGASGLAMDDEPTRGVRTRFELSRVVIGH
jgi:hypothetical protein